MGKAWNLNQEAIVADFETFLTMVNDKNKHIVYAIGWKNILHTKTNTLFINEKSDIDEYEKSLELLDEFFNNLSKSNPCKKKIVYFHNFSGFDSMFILDWIYQRKEQYKVEIFTRNTNILKIKYKNIEFRDSFKILPGSLNDLAKQFLNKTKLDFDHNLIKCVNDCIIHKEKVLNYLIKDVLLLSDVLFKSNTITNKEFNISLISSLTTASLALTFYKISYKTCFRNIKQTKDLEDFFVRKSYFGGLCNVYYPDIKDGYHYDVNSLYPYIMSFKKMPIGFGEWIYKIESIEEVNNIFGFIECKVKTSNNLLPFRLDGSLTNPVGTFSGVFSLKS